MISWLVVPIDFSFREGINCLNKFLLLIILTLCYIPSVDAGPNCDDYPEHPACGGDGFHPPSIPGSISLPSKDNNGSYTMSWGASSGRLDKYQYREKKNSGSYGSWKDVSKYKTSVSLSGKTNGTYQYQVKACNTQAGCSSARTSGTITVLHKPGTPGTFTLPSGIVSDGSYSISWKASSGVVKRYYYRQSKNNGSYGGWVNNGTSRTISYSNKSQGYYKYQVRAWNESGYSSTRTSGTVSVFKRPGMTGPVQYHNNSSDGNYRVYWGASPGTVHNYKIRQQHNGVWGSEVNIGNNNSKNYLLEFGGVVNHKVKACNPAGCSSERVGSSFFVRKQTQCNAGYGSIPYVLFGEVQVPALDVDGTYTVRPYYGVLNGAAHPKYVITQESVNGGPFYDIDNSLSAVSQGVTVTGRSAGTYRYRQQLVGESLDRCSQILESEPVIVSDRPDRPSAFTFPKPSAYRDSPEELSCLASSASIKWSAAQGGNRYQVQRRVAVTAQNAETINTNSWSGWSTIVTETSSTEISDSSLSAGTHFQYQVRARFVNPDDSNDASEWSGWRSSGYMRKPFCAPSEPTDIELSGDGEYERHDQPGVIDKIDSDGNFHISWTPSNGVVSYYKVIKNIISLGGNLSASVRTFNIIESDNGYNTYYLDACNADACTLGQPVSISVVLAANAPTKPLPIGEQPDPDSGADSANDFAGTLNGDMAVSTSGAATYHLPINVPPGTAGMTPKLSLNYNSQAGNGLLGIGWSLGGLSMIHRCPKSLAKDGVVQRVQNNKNDKFCLDGNPLIVINGEYGASGSEYRTEIDSFDHIKSQGFAGSLGVGGPAYFTVETKSGEILYYGYSEGSDQGRIEAQGQSYVSVWALSRVVDKTGNYMVFEYEEDNANGEFYIKTIRYTGHETQGTEPYETITFNYEMRPDFSVGYEAGSKITSSKRLNKITSSIGEYRLIYANQDLAVIPKSRLDRIEQCNATGDCPASRQLHFTWQFDNGDSGWQRDNAYGLAYPFVDDLGMPQSLLTDYNRDGLLDQVMGDTERVCTSGPNCIDVLPITFALGKRGGGWSHYNDPEAPTAWTNDFFSGTVVVDITGDGYVDVLKANNGPARAYIHNAGLQSGWSDSVSYEAPTSYTVDLYQPEGSNRFVMVDGGTRLLDLNGDGLLDHLHAKAGKAQQVRFNTGQGWSAHVENYFPSGYYLADADGLPENTYLADFDGNGLPDLFSTSPLNSLVSINNGEGFSALNGIRYLGELELVDDEHQDQGVRFVDINADGYLDMLQTERVSGAGDLSIIKINTGRVFSDPVEFNDNSVSASPINFLDQDNISTGVQFADVNADGRMDLLLGREGYGVGTWLNTTDGWKLSTAYQLPKRFTYLREAELDPGIYPYVRDNGVRLADINGDGFVDFLYAKGSEQEVWINQAKSNIITAVTDGLGNRHDIRYKRLTDASVYTMGNDADAPQELDVTSSLQVVHELDIPNANHNAITQRYHYEGLLVNTQGLGSQGFKRITQTNLSTGIKTITEYEQRFPYAGSIKKVEIKTNNNVLISESINEYDVIYTQGQSHGAVNVGNIVDGTQEDEKVYVPVFPFVRTKQETTHHLDNDLNELNSYVKTTTTNTYDATGNPINIDVEVSDHSNNRWRTETENEYGAAGSLLRRLGRLTKATVTKKINDQTDKNSIRITEFDYHPTTYLLTKEIVEPDGVAPNTLTIIYEHDAFGNRISTTTCPQSSDQCVASGSGPNRLTETHYDTRGRYPFSSTNAEGHSESYLYHQTFGLLAEQTGPNGIKTCFEYDSWGRKALEKQYCGTAQEIQTQFEYRYATGHTNNAQYSVTTKTTQIDEWGVTLQVVTRRDYFDRLGRTLRTMSRGFNGDYVYIDTEYNALGQTQRVSEPYLASITNVSNVIHWTDSEYDVLGRVQNVTRPVGDLDADNIIDPRVTLITTYLGFEVRSTDAKSRVQSMTKNAIGQTKQVIKALGTALEDSVVHNYDSQGNRILSIVNNNSSTQITVDYDIFGRKTMMIDPDLGQWYYQYNGFGELVLQTDAKNQKTHMSYDKLGRMISRTDLYETAQAKTSTWQYDTAVGAGIGKLASMQGEGDDKVYQYDDRGRLMQMTQTMSAPLIETGTFVTNYQYDGLNRLETTLYPSVQNQRVKMRRVYNRFGYLHYILDTTENDAGEVYWLALSADVRGQITEEKYRNKTDTDYKRDSVTGWLQHTATFDATGHQDNFIQWTEYVYDEVGNVQSKFGRANGLDKFEHDLRETYFYDDLDRLTGTLITGNFPSGQDGIYPPKTYNYDALGNFTEKSDVGIFTYDTCNAGPHAVCSIQKPGGAMRSFAYDANGNTTSYISGEIMAGSLEKTIGYTSYNKANLIIDHAKGTRAEFYYGADRNRILRVADEIIDNGDGTHSVQREHILYVGRGQTGGVLMEKKINQETGKVSYIHFIYAGSYHNGHAFAMRVLEEDDTQQLTYKGTSYFHRDHLGSVIAISDDTGLKRSNGANDEEGQTSGKAQAFLKGYDAWGKRRNANWSESSDGDTQYTSTKGHLCYTGHEAVTGVGLIHMNGRIYDPELARFTSADPHIQFENFGQSYNRYSYVLNNPIKYSDPSGYFLFTLMERIPPTMASVISIGLNMIPGVGPAVSMIFSAMWARANGASVSDIARGMIINMALGSMMKSAFSGVSNQVMAGMLSGATTGAMVSAMNGGNVLRGFVRGAAQGAVMAAIVQGNQQSSTGKVVRESRLQTENFIANNTAHTTEVSQYEPAPSNMTPELKEALLKYGESPIGRKIISYAVENDIIVTFNEVYDPADGFYVPEGNTIDYTTDLAGYRAANDNGLVGTEISNAGIDTLVAHEFGHTALGRSVLNLPFLDPYLGTENIGDTQINYLNEANINLEEIRASRLFENPYRAFRGLPLRRSYRVENDVISE